MAANVARSGSAESSNLDLLQNWDDTENPLAPLEESQRDAVIDLSVYANERPLPEEVCYDLVCAIFAYAGDD